MCTIAGAKVQRNYNCYNVYFYECLLSSDNGRLLEHKNVTEEKHVLSWNPEGVPDHSQAMKTTLLRQTSAGPSGPSFVMRTQ